MAPSFNIMLPPGHGGGLSLYRSELVGVIAGCVRIEAHRHILN